MIAEMRKSLHKIGPPGLHAKLELPYVTARAELCIIIVI